MTRKPHTIPRGTAPSAARRQPTLPPTAWWRTKTADEFGDTAANTLRAALANIAIIDEPTWRAAANGDAAAAAGLALRLDPQHGTAMAFDLVMSALAACAAEGDATATLLMSNLVRRHPGAGRNEARIATSWLMRTFAAALDKRREGVSS